MTVSILTPSFNYARFLPDALDSVALLRLDSVEHVVQDGGSTDGTREILASRNGGVVWDSRRDDGQSDALNRALAASRGRWVAWLNADEFYLRDGLERLVAAAEATDADVVYGDAVFVDEHGRLRRALPQRPFSRRALEAYGPGLSTCALLIRRDVLGQSPWDTRLRRVMDWDLVLALARSGATFHHVAAPVGAFRVHAEQVTASSAAAFTSDYELLGRRHGLRLSRPRHLAGRAVHGAYKLASGAYSRQARARRHAGADLRWFRSDDARSALERFVADCYPEAA